MKIKTSVTIRNKEYPYTLEKTASGAIHFVSKDARIDQSFLPEDVALLILDLPNLIIAERSQS
jgi:hypothetical protein